jgi:hypothetical protein
MAEGSDTYKGLAVPLNGNFEITGQVAATDIMTITGAASQTGDFIVAQTQNGTERFVVEDGGRVVIGAEYLNFGTVPTTAPTTGLSAGDLMLVQTAANTYYIACADATSQTIWKLQLSNN